MDKRFWSGAIIVVTAVVAGAGALPALLLRADHPNVPQLAAPFTPAASVDKPSAPAAQLAAALPAPAPVAPPVAAAPPVQPPARPAALPAPTRSEPVALAASAGDPKFAPKPEPKSEPKPEARPEAAAKPEPVIALPPLPPVQETSKLARVDLAKHDEALPARSEAAPPPRDIAIMAPERRKAERPARVAKNARPKPRAVRPAGYPIREFFALRR